MGAPVSDVYSFGALMCDIIMISDTCESMYTCLSWGWKAESAAAEDILNSQRQHMAGVYQQQAIYQLTCDATSTPRSITRDADASSDNCTRDSWALANKPCKPTPTTTSNLSANCLAIAQALKPTSQQAIYSNCNDAHRARAPCGASVCPALARALPAM
jgi:hypothetical protein